MVKKNTTKGLLPQCLRAQVGYRTEVLNDEERRLKYCKEKGNSLSVSLDLQTRTQPQKRPLGMPYNKAQVSAQ